MVSGKCEDWGREAVGPKLHHQVVSPLKQGQSFVSLISKPLAIDQRIGGLNFLGERLLVANIRGSW